MTLSGESAELPQGRLSVAQNHTGMLDNSTLTQGMYDSTYYMCFLFIQPERGKTNKKGSKLYM